MKQALIIVAALAVALAVIAWIIPAIDPMAGAEQELSESRAGVSQSFADLTCSTGTALECELAHQRAATAGDSNGRIGARHIWTMIAVALTTGAAAWGFLALRRAARKERGQKS